MGESNKRLLARSKVAGVDLEVKDLMSSTLTTLTADHTLWDLRETLAKGKLRHLPVVDQTGQLIGLVTERDLLRNSPSELARAEQSTLQQSLNEIPIGRIMKEARFGAILAVTPNTPLRTAAIRMQESKLGCLPVLDSTETLIGIITESDFLNFFSNQRNEGSDD